VAKTANNKGKPDKGKSARAGKAVSRRADSKPARGKASQKTRAAKPAEKKGLMKFLRDVRIEMGKVTWPTRKDLAQSTLVVLVAVAIATAYVGVLDFAFEKALAFVVNFLT
jgi:preprotein translocase subunit SecE